MSIGLDLRQTVFKDRRNKAIKEISLLLFNREDATIQECTRHVQFINTSLQHMIGELRNVKY